MAVRLGPPVGHHDLAQARFQGSGEGKPKIRQAVRIQQQGPLEFVQRDRKAVKDDVEPSPQAAKRDAADPLAHRKTDELQQVTGGIGTLEPWQEFLGTTQVESETSRRVDGAVSGQGIEQGLNVSVHGMMCSQSNLAYRRIMSRGLERSRCSTRRVGCSIDGPRCRSGDSIRPQHGVLARGIVGGLACSRWVRFRWCRFWGTPELTFESQGPTVPAWFTAEFGTLGCRRKTRSRPVQFIWRQSNDFAGTIMNKGPSILSRGSDRKKISPNCGPVASPGDSLL